MATGDKTPLYTARRLGQAVLAALVLVVGVRLFLFCPYEVSSHSMTDTLLPGDLVLVDKVVYARAEPSRGDVICFASPMGGGRDFFGRVIALGGETLEIREGLVFIGDARKPLPEPYVGRARREEFGPVVVPEGCLFVMGDNRADARDSRIWGPLDSGLVLGRVVGILFSDDPYAVDKDLGLSGTVRWERTFEAVE
ncbi:MAG: signal peptidase I [Candidatus Coatesbacteria bacterium RBG_13_66_14]|uniref:Signal peptidase I n=1 Tax=Candidatus Coatesbacteria bacterium RBG_13_66_14 TaxID=1817816 RepID=A0A1F5F751_9BACT|nr:MAG: signal peptidase I [Candidatus Coatesbacteria bacterium RBG_13_66_14]